MHRCYVHGVSLLAQIQYKQYIDISDISIFVITIIEYVGTESFISPMVLSFSWILDRNIVAVIIHTP